MSNKPNYLERGQSMARLLTGDEVSQDDLADNLMLYGPERRAEIIYQLGAEMDESLPDMKLREASKLMGLFRRLGDRHEGLRKAGR